MSATGGPGAGGAGGARERSTELRSAELVSRLLAATPPYLYSVPLPPNSYFFSEMLRSFVHAKNGTDPSRGQPLPQQPTGHRRSRKRSWNQSKTLPNVEHHKEWQNRSDLWHPRGLNAQQDEKRVFDDKYSDSNIDNNENHNLFEKPLELTTNKNALLKNVVFKVSEPTAHEDKRDVDEIQIKMRKSPKVSDVAAHLKDEKFGSLVPPAPVLSLPPPPPPLWYPPLYPPPYGIDPLNFFIDLRVSGHIYDRKHATKDGPIINLTGNQYPGQNQQRETPTNENINPHIGPLSFESNTLSAFKDNVKSNRHVSAFSVPKPRDALSANTKHFPMNLCHNGSNKFNMKYFDDLDTSIPDKQGDEKNTTSTHYVMHNLKRIYGELTHNSGEEINDEVGEAKKQEIADDLEGAEDSDSSETKKKRCKDLRALLGLELVVDYVKTGVRPLDSAAEDGGRASSDLEVIEEQRLE